MRREINEDTEAWKEIRKEQQAKHRNWHELNTKALDESGLKYKMSSFECYIFRGHIKADFYPSTGRWKDHKTNRMHRGGAEAFIAWCKKQKKDFYNGNKNHNS